MIKVLVVDHNHTDVCGIVDLGKRLVHRLSMSRELDVTHVRAGGEADIVHAVAEHSPGAVIWNYRPDLMPWASAYLTHKWPFDAKHIAIMHNYDAHNVVQRSHEILRHGFDIALVFDPTLEVEDPYVVTTARPLPIAVEPQPLNCVPRIGSFGFAFPHKNFQSVAAEAARLQPQSQLYLHIPEAYFNGASGAPLYTEMILNACHDVVHPGVEMIVTDDHVLEREVVARLAHCHVNCLLYLPGQPDAGLSSALDYLLAAQRPILVSSAGMFRHGEDAVAVWPEYHVDDLLEEEEEWTRRVRDLYELRSAQLVSDIEELVGA